MDFLFKKDGSKLRTVYGRELFKGIDDLNNIYAFSGASQGDESQSNSVEDYKFMNGWLGVNDNFKNIDYLNQDEVNKLSNKLKIENELYIQSLKDSGEYGKSIGRISIQYIENELFDRSNINKQNKLIGSYTYDIWDFSK